MLRELNSPGPDFERPEPPSVRAYDTPEPGETAASQPSLAEHPVAGEDVPGEWWHLFKSPSLDQTLRLALSDSPTLSAANATLAAAREAIVVARAGFYPKIGATAGAERSGDKGLASTDFSGGLTASYMFDVFGGTRRLVEQQESLADMQRYQLAGAYLTLTGNVVIEALTIASTRLQISTINDLIAEDRKNLALTQKEFEVGTATRADVLTAESQLAADETSLPSLNQQLSAARHALAILVGRAPGEWSAPDFTLSEFALPVDLPVTLPSILTRQRPDILAAESQLHASSAAIGIAVAQEYPNISLSAAITRESLTMPGLFNNFGTLWNVGGALTQPIFEGGALNAEERAAEDNFKAQQATYRQVLLVAFGQVADDLRALEHDAERIAAYRQSVKVAADALALQRKSYAVGTTNVLQLIDAERSYSQAKLGSASAEAQRMQDTANLFVALGGGWWNTSIAPPD